MDIGAAEQDEEKKGCFGSSSKGNVRVLLVFTDNYTHTRTHRYNHVPDRKERKEKERRQKEAELRRLKNVKRTEMLERLRKINDIGDAEFATEDFLDEEWDPQKHEAQMAAQFNDDFPILENYSGDT